MAALLHHSPSQANTVTARMRLALVAVAALAMLSSLPAQTRTATASRAADLQVGGGYSLAYPDYSPEKFKGPSMYAVYDFKYHYGVEFDFHQVNTPNSDKLYERTYELAPRYVLHYGIANPYVKLIVGRGVFNFLNDSANLAYNLYGAGAGVDINVHRKANVRIDYEYQNWSGFPPNGLTPQVFTVGAAYHF